MTYDYEGIERRLRSHRDLVAEFVPELARWFDEYLDAGEYGLAVEVVAEALTGDLANASVKKLAVGLHAEAQGMGLPDATQRQLERLIDGDGPAAS